jgi:hypothetical protein
VKRFTGLLVASALLVAPATAGAQAELPLGEADGVRVVREQRAIVIVFTKRADRLYERIAGKRVVVECTGEIREGVTSGGPVVVRAPKRPHRLVTGEASRGIDACTVSLPARTVRRRGHRPRRVPERQIVAIPLTREGAVRLDRQEKSEAIFGVLIAAESVGERLKLDGFPTHAQIVARYPRLSRVLVALPAAAAVPPPGKVGYFSDAADHVAVAAVTAAGKRLFIEFNGDVLSTNLFGGPGPFISPGL